MFPVMKNITIWSRCWKDFWIMLKPFLETFGNPKTLLGFLGPFLVLLGAVLDFGSFLEASWGCSWKPCCAKVGLLNFLKLFFRFFDPSKKHETFKGFSRLIWDSLGSVLKPFWARVWKILEAKIDVNNDLNNNAKIEPPSRRE